MLQPRSLTEILDAAFRLYRRNFALLLSITSVIYVPLILTQVGFQALLLLGVARGVGDSPESLNPLVLVAGVAGFLGFLLLLTVGNMLVQAALLYGVAERTLEREVTVGRCFRAILSLVWKLIGTSLLVGLVVGLGLLACIVPGLFFMVWWSLAIPVVVMERLGGTAAMGRSFRLSKGHRWPLFALFLIQGGVSWAIGMAIGLGSQVAIVLLKLSPEVANLANTFLSQFVAMFLVPFFQASWILMYFDMRVRKEGFDLAVEAWRLRELLGEAPPPAEVVGP